MIGLRSEAASSVIGLWVFFLPECGQKVATAALAWLAFDGIGVVVASWVASGKNMPFQSADEPLWEEV